ncbi:hypothetical protein K438DRAFT_1983820 [Mycena galopus ATCC 62051]|nr:hypothetical protein K438DRAFT_1983820 [Mycena galopus ATCC 62051]
MYADLLPECYLTSQYALPPPFTCLTYAPPDPLCLSYDREHLLPAPFHYLIEATKAKDNLHRELFFIFAPSRISSLQVFSPNAPFAMIQKQWNIPIVLFELLNGKKNPFS